MSNINFEPPPEGRPVDSSDKTSSDGGGFNFAFFERGGHPGQEQQEEKAHREVDFGDPVEVELSEQARKQSSSPPANPAASANPAAAVPANDAGDDGDEDDREPPPSPPSDHIGQFINITV